MAVVLVAWVHAEELRNAPAERMGFGVFGVDIFFVISGFILCSVVLRERRRPGIRAMRGFLARRFLRIFPIYWFFCLWEAARFVHAHVPLTRDYIAGLLLLPSASRGPQHLLMPIAWTLVFEMIFYCLLGAVLLITVRYAVYSLSAVLLALVICGSFFDIRRPIWMYVCNPIQLEFLFGAAIALAYAQWHTRRRLGIAVTALGVTSALFLASHRIPYIANGLQMVLGDEFVFQRVFTWGVSALLIVGGVVFWSPSLDHRMGKLLVVLGTASYSTYLASPLTLEFSARVVVHLFGPVDTYGKIIGFQGMIVAVALAVGWISYNYIEWPMLRRLQALLLRQKS